MKDQGFDVSFGQDTFLSGLPDAVPLKLKELQLHATLLIGLEHIAEKLTLVLGLGFG
jgi:hypothetical protein